MSGIVQAPATAGRGGGGGAILGHMPQLDALRAIAVFFVFVQHLLPPPVSSALPWGRFGVRLFFVLSGFLITSILLRCRTLDDMGNQTPGFTLRRFYIRRFLRLMPAYYAVLIVTAVAGIKTVRQPLAWHLAYLSNVYFGRTGEMSAPVVHLWSLAVEEQFYLVWPCVILFTPRRLLTPVTMLALAMGPAYRLLATFAFHWRGPAVGMQTPACFDTLAIGALLAIWSMPGPSGKASAARRRLCRAGLWIGVPATLAAAWLQYANRITLGIDAWLDLAFALTSVWLVGGAAVGFGGAAGRLLSASSLRYVGKISYGLYLYHLFVLWAVYAIAHRIGGRDVLLLRRPWLAFALISMATFAVAAASWHCFEEPISRLKRFAGYTRRPDTSHRDTITSSAAPAGTAMPARA